MKNQGTEADGKPAIEDADLFLTEEEIVDMREEFRADLEKIQEAMKAGRAQEKAGLD